MDAIERRRSLKSAVARGDGSALIGLIGGGPGDGDMLQLMGDGLTAALARQVDGATSTAERCVAALQRRGWVGDDELALQLEAALGRAPAVPLAPLPVDLEELAMVLEGDPLMGSGRIDRLTGEVWQRAAIEYAREMGEEDEDESDDERWLWVHCEGSRAGYRDMELFIDTISDARLADRLADALHGRGAFRRFRDVLAQRPAEFSRWHEFSDERQRGRARAWLAEAGYVSAHLA